MKFNIPAVLKFAGFAIVVATAFWCPNAQKVLVLIGAGAIAAGMYFPKLVK